MTPSRRARLALALFCAFVFALLALQVLLRGPVTEFDRAAVLWLAAHREPWLTQTMRFVSAMHQTPKLLAAAAVIALWRGWARDWGSVRALLVVPAGMLLNVALKDTIRRPRPSLEDPLVQLATYSFPSGHAVGSTVLYGMAWALVLLHVRTRPLRAAAAMVAVGMVVLVACSRVYLGAHYPSDVIAGIAEGTLCVLLFLRLAAR